MKINWKKALVAAGLAGLTAVPFVAIAAGIDFNTKVSDDNELHYSFRDRSIRHDPAIYSAAQSLADAKTRLWYAKDDVGGHREYAIQNINLALDELSEVENHEQK